MGKSKIILRNDSAANWATNNPLLMAGEAGYELDEGRMKIGDGSRRWRQLPYAFEHGSVASPMGKRKLILDTDWWTDCDDQIAVRVLKWGVSMGYVDVIGVCLDAVNSTSVESLSKFLDYEGFKGILIGADKQASDYDRVPSTHAPIIENWSYCDVTSLQQVDDCVLFYRSLLSSLPDGEKCDILSIGFLNAISRLLQSQADEISSMSGMDLVASKVNRIYCMGGKFERISDEVFGGSENNFNRNRRSRQAASYVCRNCPVPIVFHGYEVGVSVISGNKLAESIGTEDLLYKVLVAHGSSSGRSSWDPLCALHCVTAEVSDCSFDLVKGSNSVSEANGANTFTKGVGMHAFVKKKRPDSYYGYVLNSIINHSGWV